MKKLLLLVIMLLMTMPVFAGRKSENGVFRPTLSTLPKSYLKKFPLNKITADEVIQYVGTPDKTFARDGVEYLTVNISPKSDGVIEYTFQIKDGVVINVTYLNSGNFFGVTQRESAIELQKANP